MFQLGLGWHMTSMPRSAVMFDAFQFHKSIGIAVLLLSLLRVAVRLALPRPAPVGGARWETLLASGVHGLLYFIMIGGPLTGWALVSTAPVAMATLLFIRCLCRICRLVWLAWRGAGRALVAGMDGRGVDLSACCGGVEASIVDAERGMGCAAHDARTCPVQMGRGVARSGWAVGQFRAPVGGVSGRAG
jgi:hypothetical protein